MLNDFNKIEIEHKKRFKEYFRLDPPQISELTFTNLFMWRHKYHPCWSENSDCLIIILRPDGTDPFGLPPVGTGEKRNALDFLCNELGNVSNEVRVCRLTDIEVKRYVDKARFDILPDRNNSDYVYSALDLIQLAGRKYHKKKNHLNKFLKNYQFEYRNLDMELVECFLDMQEEWCQMKECLENPELHSEDYAIHEALTNFEELDYKGGAIQIGSKIEGFSIGEALNDTTAVIHIEKANPEIPGLYSAINNFFCGGAWSNTQFINREQDLGIEGLQKAKESYHPHHMVDKYTIIKK